uniref:CUE domain containing 2 n=1 Tax=Leptobrachium leishanense TaxID=445787 RepID=A0A8C5PKD0_9ANUR
MSVESIIQESLTNFIQLHIPDADLGAMDEVFFSYVTGVLEDLCSQDTSGEDFEMESFIEMLEGYIPGFAEIDSGKVCEMMFDLSGRLSKACNKDSSSSTEMATGISLLSLGNKIVNEEELTSSEGAVAQEECDLKASIDMLLEMFPECTINQAQKILSMAKWDLQDAVQIIVDERVSFTGDCGAKKLDKALEKENLKEFILQKYMMVDSEDDKRTHRPLAPKESPKKMIRYIDNQVVSTKGERYKDMKKPESEEMKKTYINLKPARKYKFH